MDQVFTTRGLWDIWGSGAFLCRQDNVVTLVMLSDPPLTTHRSKSQHWVHVLLQYCHFKDYEMCAYKVLFISFTASEGDNVEASGVLLCSRSGHKYHYKKCTGISTSNKRELTWGSHDPDYVSTPFWVYLLPVLTPVPVSSSIFTHSHCCNFPPVLFTITNLHLLLSEIWALS